MARVKGNFLSGVIGNVSMRVLRGEQIASRKRGKNRPLPTPGLKRIHQTFGRASSLGKQIRMLYKPMFAAMTDMDMGARLSGKLMQIMMACLDPDTQHYRFEDGSFSSLEGFDFNADSPLKKSLRVLPVVGLDGEKLTLRSADAAGVYPLRFPARATSCTLQASLALLRLNAGLRAYSVVNQQYVIHKSSPLISGLKIDFQVPGGCLCILSAFLRFTAEVNGIPTLINSKTFSPAGILGAVTTPGSYPDADKTAWMPMHGLKFGT